MWNENINAPEHVYELGKIAHAAGFRLDQNPVPPQKRELYHAWKNGWLQAENDAPQAEEARPQSETVTTPSGASGTPYTAAAGLFRVTAQGPDGKTASVRMSPYQRAPEMPFIVHLDPQTGHFTVEEPVADLDKWAREVVARGEKLRELAPDSREAFCDEAKKTITQGRNDIYGEPENSFEIIAKLWTVYLHAARLIPAEDSLRGSQVADLMELFKIARGANQNYHRDNFIDRIGYGAIAGELAAQEAKKSAEK